MRFNIDITYKCKSCKCVYNKFYTTTESKQVAEQIALVAAKGDPFDVHLCKDSDDTKLFGISKLRLVTITDVPEENNPYSRASIKKDAL